MLTKTETVEFLRLAKKGDEKAKETLIVENTSLIKCIVKRFSGRGVEYDDLFQLGAMGFIKAIYNFDESYDVRFSTYAVPMIIGEIKRFLRDDGSIKVSRMIKGLSAKINRYIEEVKKCGRNSPTVEELSEKFLVGKEDIVLALGSLSKPLSLYESVNDEGDKSVELIDKIASNEKEDDLIDEIMLSKLISELSERERKIIVLRYYGDRTQSEIAKELGVSQVQVSRLETKIVEKLKSKM